MCSGDEAVTREEDVSVGSAECDGGFVETVDTSLGVGAHNDAQISPSIRLLTAEKGGAVTGFTGQKRLNGRTVKIAQKLLADAEDIAVHEVNCIAGDADENAVKAVEVLDDDFIFGAGQSHVFWTDKTVNIQQRRTVSTDDVFAFKQWDILSIGSIVVEVAEGKGGVFEFHGRREAIGDEVGAFDGASRGFDVVGKFSGIDGCRGSDEVEAVVIPCAAVAAEFVAVTDDVAAVSADANLCIFDGVSVERDERRHI